MSMLTTFLQLVPITASGQQYMKSKPSENIRLVWPCLAANAVISEARFLPRDAMIAVAVCISLRFVLNFLYNLFLCSS